jgi:toxin ParE1/3/4
MRSYRLTKQADSDLIAIYGYGFEHFGEPRADAYHGRLENCFQLLANQPGLGKQYEVSAQDVRVFLHESHVTAYQVEDSHILIARVLSMRQNWRRILRSL